MRPVPKRPAATQAAAPTAGAPAPSDRFQMPALNISTAREQRYLLRLSAADLRNMRARLRFAAVAYDWKTKSGYQRKPDEKRIMRIAKVVEVGCFPIDSSLLLNVSPPHTIDFRPLPGINNPHGWVHLDPAAPLGVCDGNHRLSGCLKALEHVEDLDFCLSVVLTNRDEPTLRQQFLIHNSTPERVPATLQTWEKVDCIKNLNEQQIAALPDPMRNKNARLSDATLVAERLNELAEDNPFFHNIEMPNDDPPGKIISGSNLAEFARIALGNPNGVQTVDTLVTNFSRFFRAWEIRCEEALAHRDCKLFSPHVGTEVLLHCLLKLLRWEEGAITVPTVEQWTALLDHGGFRTSHAYWHPECSGHVSLHGKAEARKCGIEIYDTIRCSCERNAAPPDGRSE